MFNPLNLLRPKPKPQVRIQIVHRDPFRISMREWRQSEECCRAAQLALANPTVRQMVDILRSAHLGNWALSPDTSIEKRAIHAAKCEGYGLALNDLEALAVFDQPMETVPSTFEPDNMELLQQ